MGTLLCLFTMEYGLYMEVLIIKGFMIVCRLLLYSRQTIEQIVLFLHYCDHQLVCMGIYIFCCNNIPHLHTPLEGRDMEDGLTE